MRTTLTRFHKHTQRPSPAKQTNFSNILQKISSNTTNKQHDMDNYCLVINKEIFMEGC